MNQIFALIAPIALLAADYPGPGGGLGTPIDPAPPRQVRIEQHFSIRITPGAPVPPEVLFDLQHEESRQETRPRFVERPIGRCLPIGVVAGVKGGEGNRLLLFTRDQRIVAATLEKACRARDFYSGFYVERAGDGMICVGRDKLQSRSGANCQLKSLRGLFEAGERRVP